MRENDCLLLEVSNYEKRLDRLNKEYKELQQQNYPNKLAILQEEYKKLQKRFGQKERLVNNFACEITEYLEECYSLTETPRHFNCSPEELYYCIPEWDDCNERLYGLDDYKFYIISKNVPNKYVKYINKTYKKLLDEYTKLSNKHKELYEQYNKLNSESDSELKSKIRAEGLIINKDKIKIQDRINKINIRSINENRFKLFFKSKNNITNEINEFYAYTSISEMFCWRICFIRSDGSLNKFDIYYIIFRKNL
jgi:predicted nuclease with TOPRIM domain